MKYSKWRFLFASTLLIVLGGAFSLTLKPHHAWAVTPWGPMSEIEKAAREEAKLVIYAAPGHAGVDAKRAISKRFKEKYNISIDWTSMSARDIAPRVLAEQRTRQYVVDVTMSGIAGNYTTLKPKGYLLPMLAPSTLEKGVWRLDPANAFPKDRDWLFIYMPITPSFFINTSMIPRGEEPKSYQDLLAPKWKGKIVMQTPGRGGTGSGWFRATYRTLGLDYMKALAKQVVLVPKVNDHPEAVVRGQYPIAIAVTTTRGLMLIKQGAPVNFIHPKEGSHLFALGMGLITNTPHPNAAKLYINWFFSREGQSVYAKSNQVISLRNDVGQDHLPSSLRYVQGQPFMMPTAADQQGARPRELLGIAKKIFEKGE